MRERELKIRAFKAFVQEQEPSAVVESQKRKTLANCKLKWDGLSSVEQTDFLTRVEAEESIIEYLKAKDKAPDYLPVNYYARFLKDRLTGAATNERVNKKWFRETFYGAWRGQLSEEQRQGYR